MAVSVCGLPGQCKFVIIVFSTRGRPAMPQYPTIESCIGNTPLVRLQRLPGLPATWCSAKLEGNNPAGSVRTGPP